LTSCETAVFENVVGIWDKKNRHYLFNIAKEIMKLGYQVRCTVLYACNYGDPQKRPRMFMFIAKNNVPMPYIPPATHGSDPHLWPYVTVKDALSGIAADGTLPNVQGRETKLKPDQHGHIRLDANDVAPTLRCSGCMPFHYSEDRLITVREGASLQSFPLDYMFHGSVRSQYRQVGNAVPVELSTAVAQTFRNVLLYEYE
jgi:DNA (cytosine-5)-methyltransferase 1